jgi:hypothetical protein
MWENIYDYTSLQHEGCLSYVVSSTTYARVVRDAFTQTDVSIPPRDTARLHFVRDDPVRVVAHAHISSDTNVDLFEGVVNDSTDGSGWDRKHQQVFVELTTPHATRSTDHSSPTPSHAHRNIPRRRRPGTPNDPATICFLHLWILDTRQCAVRVRNTLREPLEHPLSLSIYDRLPRTTSQRALVTTSTLLQSMAH